MRRRHFLAKAGIGLLSTVPFATRGDVVTNLYFWPDTVENLKSLEFYGMVIDQDHNPVSGVKVTAEVGTYEGFSHGGGSSHKTTTDTEGRFSFVFIHGAGCGFNLEKAGYEFNGSLPVSSRPREYVPDRIKPAIFPIWKRRGAEPMVKAIVQAILPCDGTPLEFDLTDRHAFGDLHVSFKRDPVNIVPHQPYDATLTLSIAGGGFIEINGPYPYEAPGAGYAPSVTVELASTPRHPKNQLGRSYYIFDGKHYGRMTFDLYTHFQPHPTPCSVEVYINPSGSRNLEYDPSKQINQLERWRVQLPAPANGH
jgi:hypothetical protein